MSPTSTTRSSPSRPRSGVPWWALAYRFERELHAAYVRSGCLPPTYEPRATGHIPEMVELIERLIERGHAYPAPDGSGRRLLRRASWPATAS
jgi:cysteinyl-tRNA synthetase